MREGVEREYDEYVVKRRYATLKHKESRKKDMQYFVYKVRFAFIDVSFVAGIPILSSRSALFCLFPFHS